MKLTDKILRLGRKALGGLGKNKAVKGITNALGDVAVRKIESYKKGGKVKRTGLAYLHKGEVVIPKHKAKHYMKLHH